MNDEDAHSRIMEKLHEIDKRTVRIEVMVNDVVPQVKANTRMRHIGKAIFAAATTLFIYFKGWILGG